MLVELLQPAGPDLVRRFAAALMLVPREEREGVVNAIERRIVETYGSASVVAPMHAPAQPLTHVSEPVQRPGYVEQVETEYERPPHVPASESRGTIAGQPKPRKRAR